MVLISVRDKVDPGAIVRLEGLGQLKNPMTSSGIKPATFWLVAYVSTNYTTACSHRFYKIFSTKEFTGIPFVMKKKNLM
jgi:hypothetical protein